MNKVFSTALFRMTALYVAVLAFVCIFFSGFIYRTASDEIDRTSRRQVVGFHNMLSNFLIDDSESERVRQLESADAKRHLKINLFLVNTIMIGSGTILCYFFAKKTLEPIEESVKAQERFTSDASHELRTPLASMKTEIEVALRDTKLTTHEAKELLKSNLEEVDNLHVLTENLLLLARHREVGEVKLVDIAKVIKGVAKKYEPALKKASIKLELAVSQSRIKTNADALNQILAILIDNALKYAGSGAVLTIGNTLEEGAAVVFVHDNGPGLTDEQLQHVFDRFYKADSSRTASRSSGHGLGLSIAKQLSAALQGDITAGKGPGGKGVEFHISLPVV